MAPLNDNLGVVHQIRTTHTVSVAEYYAVGADRLHEQIIRNMRNRIADHLLREKLEVKKGDHHVEFRMETYVFHPDEFWGIVEQEARKMMQYLGRNYG